MSTRNGWTGKIAQVARVVMAGKLPANCLRCGKIVTAQHKWDVDHKVAIEEGGSLTDPSNWAVSHASCNRRHGATLTNQARRRIRQW